MTVNSKTNEWSFKLKKYKVATIMVIASLGTMVLTNAFAANTAGSKCTKAGQTVTANGQKLTCSLVWVAAKGSSAAPTPTKSSAMQSKSFRLESATFNSDFGSAGATARVTNVSKSTKTATMTITVFASDGKTVAFTMSGVVNAVGAGQTVSATFVSISGALPSGSFKYQFQVDAEF